MSNRPHSEVDPSRVRVLLWPTLITVHGLALLLAFGTWQLERLEWKNSLIAERESRLAAPAFGLDLGLQSFEALNFRRVSVRGEFLHDWEFHLLSRISKGRAGIHVVTPLAPRPGISNYSAILVNRGWVPNELSDPQLRREGQVSGLVDVEGIVRTDLELQGWFVSENDPAKGLWHGIDFDRMSNVLGMSIAPVVVESGPAPNPGGFPIGGQTRIHLRNDHLGYAITWYALAAALAAIYLLFVRRELKRHSIGAA